MTKNIILSNDNPTVTIIKILMFLTYICLGWAPVTKCAIKIIKSIPFHADVGPIFFSKSVVYGSKIRYIDAPPISWFLVWFIKLWTLGRMCYWTKHKSSTFYILHERNSNINIHTDKLDYIVICHCCYFHSYVLSEVTESLATNASSQLTEVITEKSNVARVITIWTTVAGGM